LKNNWKTGSLGRVQNVQSRRKNEHVIEFTKKLEKKSFEASNKGSGGEDSDKESNHNKDLDDECILKMIPFGSNICLVDLKLNRTCS